MTYKKLLYSLDGITQNIQTQVNGVQQEVTDLSQNVPILESGLIPARYLPSYVDDIIEGYYYNNAFYKDSTHTQLITGETGKIYVDLNTDLTYRWSRSAYVEVSKSIITGVKGDAESNYRVGNVNLTAANIGLGNVANLDQSKAIKGITRSGTTFTYTCLDGTTGTFTQQDNNTTYSAGTGLSLTNTTFALALTKKLVTDALGYTPPTQDTNTWRPLGTGANDACAGNDSRLSNSRPASDVYAWAKAATKPSYAFNEISAGAATIGDGANYILLRSNASWRGGVYWHTTGNEAMVFGNKNSVSSFIFANTDPVDRTQWNTLSPWMQIKKGCVYINSLIGNDVNPSYNLYVNGTANITSTLSQNGNAVIHAGNIGSQSVNYATSAGSASSATSATKSGDGSCILYPEYSNEINIGGSNNSTTIYFSYRAKDSRAIATSFVFGGSSGTANITANAFIKRGGTSSQFLKADGSVDSNTYITSGSYLPLTGGTISGDLSITGKCTNTAGAGSAFRWGGSGGPHYVGNNGTEAYFYSGNSLGLGLATGGSWRLYITNGGTVGIATTSPPSGYKLYVNGGAGGTSPWGNTSDMKLKNVIGDITTTFEQIANTPIFKYKWKDTNIDDDIHIGTSAQYWKEIAKEITSTSSDDIVSMEYGTASLVASVVTAKKVKEQETRIQTLEQEIEALKAELNNLKNK